jgi:hypothetical protein
MRLIIGLSFLLLFSIIPSLVIAQDATDAEADTVSLGVLLRREKAGNFMFHTLGYGGGYRFGINKTYYKNRMFEFDFLEMKAPNQVRRYNEAYANPRSYIYGKLNYLYILRAGIGRQHLLNRKPYWGGVEVRAFYYGGLDLGFARPNYLYIAYYTFIDKQIILTHTSLEKYNPVKHYPSIGGNPDCLCEIYGRGPILSGFTDIKLYPGLYFKGGLNFEYSAQNDRIKSLEAGFAVDIFPRPVPVMAFEDPEYFFITGYLSFHFGKRYN